MSAYGYIEVKHSAYDRNRFNPHLLPKKFTDTLPTVTVWLDSIYRARSTSQKIEEGTKAFQGTGSETVTAALFVNLSRTSRVKVTYTGNAAGTSAIVIPKGGVHMARAIDPDLYLCEIQSLDEDGADLHVIAWGELVAP